MKAENSTWRGGISILVAAVLSACLCAQQGLPSVHDLAQRVDQHYNTLHSLKAGFTETYIGLGMHRSESGTLLLLKPGRIRWDYTSPSSKVFLIDGKYAWFYSQGDAQVQRILAKQLDDLRSPLRFLLGRTELERELDHIALAQAPNGGFTLTGEPRGQGSGPDKHIPRVTLTVNSTGSIMAIEIEESDGAITHFTFSGEQPNAAVPPGAFHFTPPPGVPVIDAAPPV